MSLNSKLKIGRLLALEKRGIVQGEGYNLLSNLQPDNLKPATLCFNLQLLFSATLLALAGLTAVTDSAISQPTVSPCQPPQPDEFLLLVLSPTKESQGQIQQTLPPGTQTNICQYLDDLVTRIAGFRQIEDANSWARYVNEIVGLSAFVVRPAPATPSTTSSTSTNSLSYNPQPLGEGYAVLVDYFNQPEIASQVQQLLGSNVGLVSYGQRPYLLAVYTTNESAANSTLRQLSDRGFWSMVVDSRRVTLLSPLVK